MSEENLDQPKNKINSENDNLTKPNRLSKTKPIKASVENFSPSPSRQSRKSRPSTSIGLIKTNISSKIKELWESNEAFDKVRPIRSKSLEKNKEPWVHTGKNRRSVTPQRPITSYSTDSKYKHIKSIIKQIWEKNEAFQSIRPIQPRVSNKNINIWKYAGKSIADISVYSSTDLIKFKAPEMIKVWKSNEQFEKNFKEASSEKSEPFKNLYIQEKITNNKITSKEDRQLTSKPIIADKILVITGKTKPVSETRAPKWRLKITGKLYIFTFKTNQFNLTCFQFN